MSIISTLYLTMDGEAIETIRDRLSKSTLALTLSSSILHTQDELLTRKYSALVMRDEAVSTKMFDVISFIKRQNLQTKIIISVKSGGVEEAVRSMKSGASDFLIEDLPETRIAEAVMRSHGAIGHATPYDRSEDIGSPSKEAESPLIGQSQAMCELRAAISLVARSQTSVLITGESGTGKEIVARHIHNESHRSVKPFIGLNCAALPKDVMENELFGHERGAFTGALVKKAGCFEMAHEGTLFFDEIAEMTPEIQAKLLRVIEIRAFRRLGGKEEITVDVRLIAATNKNISAALKTGELREDLYYRLSTIEIVIPPLREHKEDIISLMEHFLVVFSEKYGKEVCQISDEAMELLIAFDWPGNVRELRNVAERAVVISRGDTILPQDLPHRIGSVQTVSSKIMIPLGSSAQEAEKVLILQTLAAVQNNKSKAARILGVSRKTLHTKLERFGVQPHR